MHEISVKSAGGHLPDRFVLKEIDSVKLAPQVSGMNAEASKYAGSVGLGLCCICHRINFSSRTKAFSTASKARGMEP